MGNIKASVLNADYQAEYYKMQGLNSLCNREQWPFLSSMGKQPRFNLQVIFQSKTSTSSLSLSSTHPTTPIYPKLTENNPKSTGTFNNHDLARSSSLSSLKDFFQAIQEAVKHLPEILPLRSMPLCHAVLRTYKISRKHLITSIKCPSSI